MTVGLGTFTQGEIPDPLAYTFDDANGTALDIGTDDLVNVTLLYTLNGGTPVMRLGSWDATTSTATVVFEADDMAAAGVVEADLWAGNGLNRYASVRLVWVIRPSVGDPPDI